MLLAGHADCVKALFENPVVLQDSARGRQVPLADTLVTEGLGSSRFSR
jgi:hypothetical protein